MNHRSPKMPESPKTLLIAVVVAFTLIAAACSDSNSAAEPTTTTSAPATTVVTTTTTGPQYRATIRRTENNVPHILADDLGSLGFGYGYAFSEDQLCSLADVIVQVNSQQAKYHGPDYLPSDVVYKAIDLLSDARAEFDGFDPDLQSVIRGYAAGYNTYLEEVGADGISGWCRGAEWLRPIDEYDLAAYYKSLTFRASLNNFIDMVYSAAPPEASTNSNTSAPSSITNGSDESALATTADGFAQLAGDPNSVALASNAWAIGPDRTLDGTTMLMGNPHFPWQGALRFYEVQLTVPGEINVYGASLLGSPAVVIGFNDNVAWSHTVSAGNRFTAYTLDLVPGDPTSYVYGDTTRKMTSRTVEVEVLNPDTGEVSTQEHTVWFSHYGPVLNFPGIGWSDDLTITIRDANADNATIMSQFFDMDRAGSMDDLIEAHRRNQGIPWVNTVAASAEGRIWYADTSATPNLSDEAIAAWQAKVDAGGLEKLALDRRVVLLDGSDPLFEWVDEPGARSPGLVPFDKMPQLERSDFLFNANDPYWMTNPAEPLTGYSPLHGIAESVLSRRTRMNAIQLGTNNGDSGPDGLYTLDELAASALGNRVLTAELLVDQVIQRCEQAGDAAPPSAVDGCLVLLKWDRRVNLDSRGAVVWREFISRMGSDVWATKFDPSDPINTPSGLTPSVGVDDEVLAALATAVDIVRSAGFALDAPLGDVQFADRGGVRVPIHGGTGSEGVTNVVVGSSDDTTSEPNIDLGQPVAEGTDLTTEGYPISYGTSFIYALEFTAEGPVAKALLTYGNTGDPTSPYFSDQTRRFSDKDWRSVAFTEDAIAADGNLNTYEVSR